MGGPRQALPPAIVKRTAADALVVEATFLESNASTARDYGLTAAEAAELAALAR
jgi:ribonuclease BN (tRNA processing enzyme)